MTSQFELDLLVSPPPDCVSLHPESCLIADLFAYGCSSALSYVVSAVPDICVELFCVIAFQLIQLFIWTHPKTDTFELMNSVCPKVVVQWSFLPSPCICLVFAEPLKGM